jgi:hypothetical protein
MTESPPAASPTESTKQPSQLSARPMIETYKSAEIDMDHCVGNKNSQLYVYNPTLSM